MSVRATDRRRGNSRSSDPLGSSGDWRRRLLLHHAPLALASAVVLVLFMTLPLFTAAGGFTLDMGSSSAFPQQRERGEGGAMDMDVGGEHGGRQAEPADGGGEHGGRQAGSMGPDDMTEMEGMGRHSTLGGINTQQLTVATGWVATGLLGLTLLVGPANLLLRRRTPVSSYLARDVGTWAAIFSVVHVFYGIQEHGTGTLSSILGYFVRDGRPLINSFGLGNWTGLAATVIVVALLALSSNFALRKLKAKTWKDLQRLNYTLFALVILHAFFYGALLRITSPFTLLGILVVVAVVVGQAVGIWLWQRRSARRAAAAA